MGKQNVLVVVMVLAASIPASAGQQDDWLSYNRTLTSQRFAPHDQITRDNVKRVKVVCTYDTKLVTSFQTGPIVVAGVLYGTTEAAQARPGPDLGDFGRARERYEGSIA